MNGYGLLWYDPNPKKSLAEKLEAAASYFALKYGQRPTLAHVNGGDLIRSGQVDQAGIIAGLLVKPTRTIQPNHFWLGVDNG